MSIAMSEEDSLTESPTRLDDPHTSKPHAIFHYPTQICFVSGLKFQRKSILIKFACDPEIRPGLHLYGGAQPAPDIAGKALAMELKTTNRLLQFLFSEPLGINVAPQLMLGQSFSIAWSDVLLHSYYPPEDPSSCPCRAPCSILCFLSHCFTPLSHRSQCRFLP
jgi:hypothetical protein